MRYSRFDDEASSRDIDIELNETNTGVLTATPRSRTTAAANSRKTGTSIRSWWSRGGCVGGESEPLMGDSVATPISGSTSRDDVNLLPLGDSSTSSSRFHLIDCNMFRWANFSLIDLFGIF
ncbi:unnamed protein product [Anisakis simplex]|uniref:Uncharacterized protein n=1 Tax=Anisakis simplex TaxID=6269 RepID=A0A0M3J7A8_ANISI|nr:unnamed protein product [Anisakis simplex]